MGEQALLRWPATTTYSVSVLVEPKDAPHFYVTWKGESIRGIRRAARARYAAEYPGARVSFGAALSTNSYGAH